MNFDQFLKLVKNRQSCRSFDNRPVEKEKIQDILDLVRLSPSACNLQPWSFVVLSGKSAKGIEPFLQPFGTNKFTTDCPIFVAVVEEKSNLLERLGERFLGQDFGANDIGIAVSHMTLAAEAYGLGSCILGAFREQQLKDYLEIKNKRVRLVVAIGYPKEGYEVREKVRKTDFITFRD